MRVGVTLILFYFSFANEMLVVVFEWVVVDA